MLIYVKDAHYIKDYQITIEFTDGLSKTVDLKEHLKGKVFEPLKDMEYFRNFKVNKDTETIEWSNGADFAPAFLYNL
jgi:hypothetical protein